VLWFMARRHLAGGGKNGLLSLISWIALAGVTLGVSALVVVTAVMTGMQEELRSKILEAYPHVLVLEHGTSLRLSDWERVVDVAMATDGVMGASPFVLTQVTVVRGTGDDRYSQSADLYGILRDPGSGAGTIMEERIAAGEHELEPPLSGLPPLLLGSGIADRMQLFGGDTVLVVAFENLRPDIVGGYAPTLRQFEVTGTFTTGMYDYDIKNAYTTLDLGRELLGISEAGVVSGVGVRTTEGRAAEVARVLSAELGSPYSVESWETTNRALFSALKLEKIAMGVILFLIVLVAAFNIVSTLVMVVADRTREIGILRAMGMRRREVAATFLIQGLWIGMTGTVIGTTIGILAALAVGRYELIRIPPDVYFVDHLPVSLRLADMAWIVGASILVSLIATLYPALQAGKLEPVEAIRDG